MPEPVQRNLSARSVRDNDSDNSGFAGNTDESNTLYDQLGGDKNMKIFIDFFLDGIMEDE